MGGVLRFFLPRAVSELPVAQVFRMVCTVCELMRYMLAISCSLCLLVFPSSAAKRTLACIIILAEADPFVITLINLLRSLSVKITLYFNRHGTHLPHKMSIP